jgi:LEA14-like dessication related protein
MWLRLIPVPQARRGLRLGNRNCTRPRPGLSCFTIVILALVTLTGCANLTERGKAPELALVGVTPAALTLDRQTFVVRLRVKNPNERSLPIKAITYHLDLDGNELAHGSSALDRAIPAFGEELVDVEVDSNLLALLAQLPILAARQEKLRWRIHGTVTVGGGLVPLPYWYSGEIDPRDLMVGSIRQR